jgi:hypothetical protein
MVGTQGVLVIPHVARPMLYPDKKFKDFKFPDVVERNQRYGSTESVFGVGVGIAETVEFIEGRGGGVGANSDS